jgi:hypothetical protein
MAAEEQIKSVVGVPGLKTATPTVELPPGHSIPVLSNGEIASLFDHEDLANLNDVYRGR